MTLTFGVGEYSYGFLPNGERVLVSNTAEQIAAFIMANRLESVRIVNVFDDLEIETSMGLVMTAANQQFLTNELLPILIPMQQGEVKPPEFIPYSTDKYVIKNVRLERKEGTFVLANIDHFESVTVHEISEHFKTEAELIKKFPDSISVKEEFEIASKRGLV